MKRRAFFQRVAAVSLAAASGQVPGTARCAEDSPQLSGFIVSDAHFGWDNEQQPDPALQRAAVRHILERFPDLDIVIDTGDAYHGNLRGLQGDMARALWLDIIANGVGALPFLYVPGNHEIIGTSEGDHEQRCCRLGSLACRPYYSFDVQGIHFVSLPEMVRAVYVTRETLEWLALDLAVHRDRTTIILSHNNIKGTTGPLEPGYRGLVNSDVLTRLFGQNPQVIAWMHGHNHNYEVVRKGDMLFVSNGRIGGFDPSRRSPGGSHGLGGIHFSVTREGLAVRSYSVDRRAFLDETGVDAVAARLETRTSFAPGAPAAICYGYGGARDGQRMPVYHHFQGQHASRTLVMAGADSPVFNDDAELNLYDARSGGEPGRPSQKMLMGSDVRGRRAEWEWANPGVTLRPPPDSEEPVFLGVPRVGHGKINYFRCAPGKGCRFRMVATAESAGGMLIVRGYMHDSEGGLLYEHAAQEHPLREGSQEVLYLLQTPALPATETIYGTFDSNLQVQVSVEIEFRGFARNIHIQTVELGMDNDREKTVAPGISIGEEQYVVQGVYGAEQLARMPIARPSDSREVVECHAGGNQRMTWLIREEGVQWQVRNAAACMRDGRLEIGPVRANWSEEPAIMIAPIARRLRPFVHRLNNISKASVHHDDENNAIDLCRMEYGPGATVELWSPVNPAHITGGNIISMADARIVIEVGAPTLCIRFS